MVDSHSRFITRLTTAARVLSTRILDIGMLGFSALSVSMLSVSAPSMGGVAMAQEVVVSTPETPRDLQRVTVNVKNALLTAVLHSITRQAGLVPMYDATLIPSTARVTVHVRQMPADEALQQVLSGTGLIAQIFAKNQVVIMRGAAAAQGGTVTGVITDATTKRPVGGATVMIDAKAGVKSNDAGSFRLGSVAAGTHRLTVRRLGYQLYTGTITVAENETTTHDVALSVIASRLTEVVTTAVGRQRRLEVGNSIAHLNVDSISRTAPVANVTELLAARAPGVQIVESSGLVGSGPVIRIRGQSSLLLSGDPIIVVDGIRQDKAVGAAFSYLFQAHETPSRINDIDFSQIETIDILKGPTASTEYGTDAANGVIVITTKRGVVGPPRWRLSMDQSATTTPQDFEEYYTRWGHLADNSVVICPLASRPGLASQTSTTLACVVDSVVHYNPLNHAATTVFGTGRRGKYDLSVGGGTDAVRYFIAGGMSSATGNLRLPDVFRARATALGFPAEAFRANTQDQKSVRGTMQIRLAKSADLDLTGAYLRTDARLPNLSLGNLSTAGPLLPDSAHNYGYGPQLNSSPIWGLGGLQNDVTARNTGGISLNWNVTDWLVTHATTGLDRGTTSAQSLLLPQATAMLGWGQNQGSIEIYQTNTDIYSGDIRASATSWLSPRVRSVTSFGAQFANTRTRGINGSADGLAPGNLSLNGAAGPSVHQTGDETATLGGYTEEQIALADRFFLAGALRLDAGSGFGNAYNAIVYPKASISWLALGRHDMTLRLRSAFGESGVQPSNGAALQLYLAGVGWGNGGTVSANRASTPGNPQLKPERSREVELGMDVGLLHNRVNVEWTYYRKSTSDALVQVNPGWDVGGLAFQENLGDVENRGTEATVTASVLRSPTTALDFTLNVAANTNKLVRAARGTDDATGAYFAGQQNRVGYPLFGYWARQVQYADTNGNGIIELGEYSLSDTNVYLGSSLPTKQASLTTHVGLFGGALSVNALIDYRGGYRVHNAQVRSRAFFRYLYEQNVASAPLWLQARAAATDVFHDDFGSTYEHGSFTRFRELSVTYAVPRVIARARDVAITTAVRNVALWSKYTAGDPEVSAAGGGGAVTQFGTGLPGVNNDLRSSNGAIPLSRSWMVRVNVGL
jgi:TonB-dependent SusC/RagA subfamily outer membrane receptor